MGSHKEDYESFELEARGGNGSPTLSIDNAQSLSFSDNDDNDDDVNDDDDDDDDESRKRKELAKSLPYTPEEERAVVRKLDRRLVLFVAFLYMLSFLDRSSKPIPLTPREQ